MLVLVGCAALWSLNGPLIKLLVQTDAPGVTIACYRSLFGGVVFLPLALRRMRTLQSVRVRWRIGSVVVFTLMTVCFVVSTTQTAAANAIILQYTAPVWVFFLSPLLLREPLRLRDGSALPLAMAGVAIIFFGHPTGHMPALVLGLTSGLGFGLVIIALRGLRNADPTAVVALNFVGSGLLLIPAVMIWGTLRIASPQQFGLLLALGIVQMAVPYLLFSWALKHVEAHRASLIVLLETVFNPILTYLFVGESVPVATLVGGPLILASVVGWMLLTWRREARSLPPVGGPPARARPRILVEFRRRAR
jgi:drug/metabolite transporter (DMT)-like permease